jgi:hypothetical protein
MAWYDFLNNVDWSNVATKTIPAAVGSYLMGNANEQAANTVANASNQASQLQLAQAQRNQALLQPTIQASAPATDYLKTVMGTEPSVLTPQQQQYVADTRRTTGQQLQSNLGGRSASAVATDAANRVQANTVAQNQQRSDQAAQTLQGVNTNALNSSVGIGTNATNNVANNTINTGNTIGQAGLATADAQAQSLGSAMSPSFLDVLNSFNANDRKNAGYQGGYKTGL